MPRCGARVQLGVELKRAADELLPLVLEAILPEVRTGGFLASTNLRTDGTILFPVLIGDAAEGKKPKYAEFAGEKLSRLGKQYRAREHRSSYQSRRPLRQKWGGAVSGHDRGGNEIGISFSGLPELADEALCLAVGIKVGLLTYDEAQAIADISDNWVWEAIQPKLAA